MHTLNLDVAKYNIPFKHLHFIPLLLHNTSFTYIMLNYLFMLKTRLQSWSSNSFIQLFAFVRKISIIIVVLSC